MRRRGFIGWLISTFAMIATGQSRALARLPARARPGRAGWPSLADWDGLRRAVGGRLENVEVPKLSAAEAQSLLRNPFYLRDTPAFTESSGWVDAWISAPSAFVVKAKDAYDVAAAVKFAKAHRLRLVVRGGGHSYVGGSSSADSLLVWTRAMDDVALHAAFVPRDSDARPVPAVSLGAGCVWMDAYKAVTVEGGRFVQGGGCTSVGVAGFVLGGGFGSFSKAFGLGAANLLEAEVVTADGEIRTVNARREPDLFWALKGGGGGTFGVATRLTLATHELPSTFGGVNWTVQATSDAAYRRLLRMFLQYYPAHLMTPHWGEQAHAMPGNRLQIEMAFQGLTPDEATAAWRGLVDEVAADPQAFKTVEPFSARGAPARIYWNAGALEKLAPGIVKVDHRPNAEPGDFWWPGDGIQASAMWHGYQSVWLPSVLLQGEGLDRLTDAWFNASRLWSVSFHFNKGLAGGAPQAVAGVRETSINPQVADAFALAIIAMLGGSSYAGLPPPDVATARENAKKIASSMEALCAAAPDGGCYMSECDFFLKDWQRAQWGEHAARLEAIKRRYDPDGLFVIHHGVGSQDWTTDGFNRIG